MCQICYVEISACCHSRCKILNSCAGLGHSDIKREFDWVVPRSEILVFLYTYIGVFDQPHIVMGIDAVFH
jgi:hypothetical protein